MEFEYAVRIEVIWLSCEGHAVNWQFVVVVCHFLGFNSPQHLTSGHSDLRSYNDAMHLWSWWGWPSCQPQTCSGVNVLVGKVHMPIHMWHLLPRKLVLFNNTIMDFLSMNS